MVIINQLNIDVTGENIEVDVTTSVGNIFTSLLFWTSDTYDNPADAIDLSSLYAGTSENETFTIPASAVGLSKFSGLFFLKFETDEIVEDTDCCPDTNIRLAVVANFIKYHECILDKLLKLDIDDCGLSAQSCAECNSCQDCAGNAPLVHLFLSNLYIAIQQGFYAEAIEIIENLDTLCQSCSSCPDYGNALKLAGGGFGIYQNKLTLLC
jgi:hypothetical protein